MTTDETIDLYVCRECDWIGTAENEGAIGKAHAHAERHVGVWKFPPWVLPVANPKKLDEVIDRVEARPVTDGDRDE